MPRDLRSLVFVGIKSSVIALDRKTGAEVWRIGLPAKYRSTSSIVNVVRDEEGLFASCSGELFSLDPRTGELRWKEPLKGLGTGLVTIATDLGGATSAGVVAAAQRQSDAARAAAAS